MSVHLIDTSWSVRCPRTSFRHEVKCYKSPWRPRGCRKTQKKSWAQCTTQDGRSCLWHIFKTRSEVFEVLRKTIWHEVECSNIPERLWDMHVRLNTYPNIEQPSSSDGNLFQRRVNYELLCMPSNHAWGVAGHCINPKHSGAVFISGILWSKRFHYTIFICFWYTSPLL